MRPLQRRAEPRQKVTIRALIRDTRPDRDICILDLSSRGMLATTKFPPARGEFVEVLLGRVSHVGHVKWASEHRFGIALRDKIDAKAVERGEIAKGRAKLAAPHPSPNLKADVRFKQAEARRTAQAVNFLIALAASVTVAVGFGSAVKNQFGALARAGEVMGRGHFGDAPTRQVAP